MDCDPWGFLYKGDYMNIVIFLIDGFNLYHSLIDASYDLKLNGKGTKWLNIYSLC